MRLKWITIAFIIAMAIIVGLLWNEEKRMDQGNWREGASFANLEVGDSLAIENVSLIFMGETETEVKCDDFPSQSQEECKKAKFFAFKIKDIKVPFKVYQGHTYVYVALEGKGTRQYEKTRDTVIFSDNGSLFVDSLTRFYELKYESIRFNGNITEFSIKTVKKS